jgi:hypothetical protein
MYNMLSRRDVYLNESLLVERGGEMMNRSVQAEITPAGWTNYSNEEGGCK